MDLCVCSYEVDDPDADNLLNVLMMITLMKIKVSGNRFPNL